MKELSKLYNSISKHSNYQILPYSLNSFSNNLSQNINRFEIERFNFISEHLNFKNAKILDIGSNTGYFSITSIENGAQSCDSFEGNTDHSIFLNKAAKYLNFNISVYNEYYHKNIKLNNIYDITFFLNVAHHIGDDFDKSINNIELAKKQISLLFNPLIGKSNFIIFQIGYCWMGNTKKLLFQNGTKLEQIKFITQICEPHWIVEHIGILEDDYIYRPANKNNLLKNPKLKEFGNRPLFILKSCKNSPT